MIKTEQTVPVRAPIGAVWDYVKNIGNWAELMPGLQSCDIIDEDDSRWVLKVGVGALVRTVKVNVHVQEWDGPTRVLFKFKLQGDPVEGGGTYMAVPRDASSIDMTLSLYVEGTGPMAPMWEAMGQPLLPKFALAFAHQLAEGIEKTAGTASIAAPAQPAPDSLFRRLLARLQDLWRSLTAAKAN